MWHSNISTFQKASTDMHSSALRLENLRRKTPAYEIVHSLSSRPCTVGGTLLSISTRMQRSS